MALAIVKVLIEGYAREENGVEYASSTAVLIQESGSNIIVDPGMDRERLLKALEKKGMSACEIDYIVLTHCHPDHFLLSGIFKNAKILDDERVYSWCGRIEFHSGNIPGTKIAIIKTPGHDLSHCSVLIDTEKYGRVAISGDVFWWRDSEEQKIDNASLMAREDPYTTDKNKLTLSRKKLLEMADYIIPGHGKMFKLGK